MTCESVPSAFWLNMIYHGDYLTTNIQLPAHLIVTSPPYPLLKGCPMDVPTWLIWFGGVLTKMHDDLHPDGVLVLNVNFPRCDNGSYDVRLWSLPFFLDEIGFRLINIYAWDKLNSPPSGNHKRYARNEWEPVFVAAKSASYHFQKVYKPYSPKTISRVKSGKLRGISVDGSHSGGHNRLNPNGAALSNVLRFSSFGQQKSTRCGCVHARKARSCPNALLLFWGWGAFGR